MTRRKDMLANGNTTSTGSVPPALPTSRLPRWSRFPLLFILSASLHQFFYSMSQPFIGAELATVSRRLDEAWQPFAVLSLKAIELGVGWNLGYDGM